MNVRTLKSLLKLRQIRPAELARQVGVSRQAVSNWLTSDELDVNIQSRHLQKLAQVLRIKADDLINPFWAKSAQDEKTVKTDLLWDHLYPDLESLALALARKNKNAMARLVQVYGLFAAMQIAGSAIWRNYPQYKHFIKPAYRKTTDIVWSTCTTRDLI